MNLHLRLYVAGTTPRSLQAMSTVRMISELVEDGQCSLEVIDVLEAPLEAERARIMATPTLEKLAPLPTRRLVGDLSDVRLVLDTLGLDHTGTRVESGWARLHFAGNADGPIDEDGGK